MGASVLDFVPLWAATLAKGESQRSICPVCRATERSFVVTRLLDGSLAWICHRAHCGIRGRTNYVAGAAVHAARCPLPAPELRLDWSRVDKWGYPQDTNSGGYCRTITGLAGSLGFQLRWYDGRKPKTKTYLTSSLTCETMHWEPGIGNADPSHAVLVEDIPSAHSVAKCGYDAVALLGTLFNPARGAELKDAGYSSLAFLLDRDAYGKSVRYAREWAPFFDTVAILPDQDPKDTDPVSLTSLLEAHCGTKTTLGSLPASTL